MTQIFLPGSLNIFCDASINPLEGGKYEGCAGCVPVICKNNEPYSLKPVIAVLPDCTNNIAELTAIQLAVKFARTNQKYYNRINIFSDSQISVFGLRDWIWGWMRNINPDGFMTSSSGTPVKNDTIIYNIINMISGMYQQVNLYHQKGHAVGKLEVVKNTFFKSNRIHLTDYDAQRITLYNDFIDRHTRDSLLNRTYQDNEIMTVLPFGIIPVMKEYYPKIKKEGFE